VTWKRDDAKLNRVRELMAQANLDALVVRAPDNVLYLTNFWGMKGYDACVFPREGEPVLITIEASEPDAERAAWTTDIRYVKGYAPDDPRPVPSRTLDASAWSSRSERRRPTAWSASRRRSPRRGSTRGPARRTRWP
jgi:Xaa-Pro aminopeptidase